MNAHRYERAYLQLAEQATTRKDKRAYKRLAKDAWRIHRADELIEEEDALIAAGLRPPKPKHPLPRMVRR